MRRGVEENMPSFFSRKKKGEKNKHKPKIQDALAPTPTFTNTPQQPDKTLASPQPVSQVTAGTKDGDSSGVMPGGRVGAESNPTTSIEIQSEWLLDEEDDLDPGYSMVRRMEPLTTSSSGGLDRTHSKSLPQVPPDVDCQNPSLVVFSPQKPEDIQDLNILIGHDGAPQLRDTTKKHSPSEKEIELLYTKVKKTSRKSSIDGGTADLSPEDPVHHRSGNRFTKSRQMDAAAGMKDEPNQREYRTRDDQKKSTGYKRERGSPLKRESGDYRYEEEGFTGYIDEEYLPSEDDESISITLTLSDEEEDSYSQQGYLNVSREMDRPNMKSRPSHPAHRPPISATRSVTPGRHKIRSPKAYTTPRRPVSAPQGLDNIPFIQPSFIQQLTPAATQPQPSNTSPDVYIFSEQQKDGSIQYYSAVSVQPSSLVNQGSPQSLMMTPPPLTQHPAAHKSWVPSAAHLKMEKDGNLLESGYLASSRSSSHLTNLSPFPTSGHALDAYKVSNQQSPYGVLPSQRQKLVVGTKISKLGDPVHRGEYPKELSPPKVNLFPPQRVGTDEQNTRPPEAVNSLLTSFPGLELAGVIISTPNKEENTRHQEQEKLENAEKEILSDVEREQLKMMKVELAQVVKQMEELQKENNKLLDDKQFLELEKEKWSQIEESTYSMSDQNASLVKQLKLHREQMKELKEEHNAKVSQLNGQVQRSRNERQILERELADLKDSHTQLQKQFQKLARSFPAHVTVEEHREVLDDMQGLIDNLSSKNMSELQLRETHMRIQEKEKKSLIYKLTDATAVILKLEKEKAQLYKSIRKAQERIEELQNELECSRDREISTHHQLSLAVAQAEKATVGKKTLAKIAKAQRRSIERTATSKTENDQAISSLERKMEDYELDTLLRLDKASLVLHKSEKNYQYQRKQYQEEIKHLRAIIDRKQEQLEQMSREKRCLELRKMTAEDRLDLVWRASISGRPKLDRSICTPEPKRADNTF